MSVYDALVGGKPVVEATTSVPASGQWSAVPMVLPAGYGAGGWKVTATCQASDPDSADQSYMQYGTVPVAAA